MPKTSMLMNTIMSAALLCGSVAFAQDPVQDIDGKLHPNLAAAQHHIVEANKAVVLAQKDNSYDMQGHAERARQHMVEANDELKLAAEAANAAKKNKK